MGSKPQAVPSGLVLQPGSGQGAGGRGGAGTDREGEKGQRALLSPSQQTSGLLSWDKNLIFKDKNEEEFRRNLVDEPVSCSSNLLQQKSCQKKEDCARPEV